MPKTHYCYFVRCGEFVKIGYSQNMEKRLEVFRTHNPQDPEVLALLPFATQKAAREREKWMHGVLAEHQVSREWFNLKAVLHFLQHKPKKRGRKDHKPRH